MITIEAVVRHVAKEPHPNDIIEQDLIHLFFTMTNLIMLAYACIAFIGLKQIIADIFINLQDFVYKSTQTQPNVPEPEVPHWQSVLYIGSALPEETYNSTALAVTQAAQDLLETQGQMADHKKRIKI